MAFTTESPPSLSQQSSRCVNDLFCDGSLCCPTCCEIHSCVSPAAFPAVPASPIPSPKACGASSEGDRSLMPPLVSVSPRPDSSPSLTASPSPASTGMPQAPFGSSEEAAGAGSAAGISGPSENKRLASFLSSVTTAEDNVVPGLDNVNESEEEEDGEGLCCLVTDCGRERMSSDYFCSRHVDKGKRVSWKAAKRMVQTMSKGLYSMSTVVQGEKLGQFLDTEMPSMNKLKPEILSERFQRQETVTLGEALFLIDQALEILRGEPNALELKAPVKIVGDLHGQFFDLISMLDNCGSPRDGSSYLFLGDYVDRGEFSCEVLLYLLALKVEHPQKIHLIRGNHECRSLTTHFGFKDECKAKYGLPVYYRFLRCFELMPLCALIDNEHGRYFCTHGGISPGLTSLDQIAALNRRAEPEMDGLLCDLLWADPSDDPGVTNIDSLSDQELDSMLSSTFQFNRLRGCSVAFGYLAVKRFLDNNNLLCVIRAHAVQEDGYYRHFEKALKKRSVDTKKELPPVITVFSAPNYCDRYGNRAAVLELLVDHLEPRVEHFECVDHPDRLNRPDRSEVHLTALIESCPYMPTTFRDFVKIAGRMGPAQPLTDGGDASESSSVVGGGGAGETLSAEMEGSLKSSAPSSPPQRKDRSWTAHDLYELEAAHDRINELHPDYLNARIESCEDEGVSRLSTKANIPSSISSLVGSTTKITVSELRNRFDPAARRAVARPIDMGNPRNTVTEITRIFEHKARSDRRKALDVRDCSGSGGIVSQMKASIESKARASGSGGGSSGGQTSTKQKISVFEALTKRGRNGDVATKLTRVKDSALARRIWVDKVAVGPSPQTWREGRNSSAGFSRGYKRGGNGAPHARVGGSVVGGGSSAEMFSQRRHSSSSARDGKFPPPPPPGASVPRSGFGEGDIGGGGGGSGGRGRGGGGGGNNYRSPWRSPSKDDTRRTTLGNETGNELDDLLAQREQERHSEETAGGNATRDSSPVDLSGARSVSDAGQEPADADFFRHGETDEAEIEHAPSPPELSRKGTFTEECAFTHAEILGLKLLFALMDQRGSQFIDGVALEEYADEQDDFAQEREIEACIKAVDVDNDGKIGLMDFICFAARLKCYYEDGVGLQKTLTHAGNGGKRPPGMSMPGDSDSDDDDDDDDDDEQHGEEEHGDHEEDDDDQVDEGGGGEHGDQGEEGEHEDRQDDNNQVEEDSQEDYEEEEEGETDHELSGADSSSQADSGRVVAGGQEAAQKVAAAGTCVVFNEKGSTGGPTDAGNVPDDPVISQPAVVSLLETIVHAEHRGAGKVPGACKYTIGEGIGSDGSRGVDVRGVVEGAGILRELNAIEAGTSAAASAGTALASGRNLAKQEVSRTSSQGVVDVITVSSVSAAISAAVEAVSTPGRHRKAGRRGPRVATE